MSPPSSKLLEAVRAELSASIDARQFPIVMERIERRLDELTKPTIRAWRNPIYGALVCDAPIEGVTQKLDAAGAIAYGHRYFIASAMSLGAASAISEALGLDFRGEI